MRNAELRSALHKLGALRMLAAASAAMFHAAHRLLVLRLLLAAIRVLAEPARHRYVAHFTALEGHADCLRTLHELGGIVSPLPMFEAILPKLAALQSHSGVHVTSSMVQNSCAHGLFGTCLFWILLDAATFQHHAQPVLG
jgi:hypothetical protein